VENALLEVVKHADLHCIEEIGLKQVAQNTGNMSKQVQFSGIMAQREFCIGCLGVGMAEGSI
jgi:hypothetical protein